MKHVSCLESIIQKLLRDERIKRKEGTINSYNRYSYKEKRNGIGYEEVLQQGFKISVLINEGSEYETCITLYVWLEECSKEFYVKNSLHHKVIKIDKKDEKALINVIIGLILNEELNKNLNKVINL